MTLISCGGYHVFSPSSNVRESLVIFPPYVIGLDYGRVNGQKFAFFDDPTQGTGPVPVSRPSVSLSMQQNDAELTVSLVDAGDVETRFAFTNFPETLQHNVTRVYQELTIVGTPLINNPLIKEIRLFVLKDVVSRQFHLVGLSVIQNV